MNPEEAHRHSARQTNGRVWELLEKRDRTPDEGREMLAAAYASLFHWLQAGTVVHEQRGEWLIATAHLELGQQGEALRHARHCRDLTEANQAAMEDFDVAFAEELMARVDSLRGEDAPARQAVQRALAAGQAIRDAEDRQIFFDTLRGGPWGEVRPE
jgi:hypothetical protein